MVETQAFHEIELTYSLVWGLLPPSQLTTPPAKIIPKLFFAAVLFFPSFLSTYLSSHQRGRPASFDAISSSNDALRHATSQTRQPLHFFRFLDNQLTSSFFSFFQSLNLRPTLASSHSRDLTPIRLKTYINQGRLVAQSTEASCFTATKVRTCRVYAPNYGSMLLTLHSSHEPGVWRGHSLVSMSVALARTTLTNLCVQAGVDHRLQIHHQEDITEGNPRS